MQPVYGQGCAIATPNEDSDVSEFTIVLRPTAGDRRAAIDGIAARHAGVVTWRASERCGREYGLVEGVGTQAVAEIEAAARATVYPKPIIAVAIYPGASEALPVLEDALGGTGRPAGVLACERVQAGLVVEWDPSVSQPAVISALIDLELRRFGGARTIELLSPLTADLAARIAAKGLQTPEIGPDRVLETLVQRAGLTGDA